MKKLLVALLLALSAGGALAISNEHERWVEGPEKFLMTRAESTAWKDVTTDEQAEKFIALFWARRDPTPGTKRNEFREEFERRVTYASENFAASRTDGATSDRGRVLILLGPPERIQSIGRAAGDALLDQPVGDETLATQTWIYEGERVPPFAGADRFEVTFVDYSGRGAYELARTPRFDVRGVMDRAVTSFIVSPSLDEAPNWPDHAVAMAPNPVPEEQTPTSFSSPELQSAVDAYRVADERPSSDLHLTWGEFVTSSGEYFVPVQLYLDGGAELAKTGETLTFFGSVADERGAVSRVWELPAGFTALGEDAWFDVSLDLEPGKYDGVFGLARGAEIVTMSAARMDLAGIDPAAPSVSKLILSNSIYPLAEAQMPTDPFSFGGLKVVPKGDLDFTKKDDLWYFIELRHPGLDETEVPSLQVGIDVNGETAEGKPVKMGAPAVRTPAQELKGVEGHWAIGSSIPLTGFSPGKYTMKIKVFDSVLKVTYNFESSFTIE